MSSTEESEIAWFVMHEQLFLHTLFAQVAI